MNFVEQINFNYSKMSSIIKIISSEYDRQIDLVRHIGACAFIIKAKVYTENFYANELIDWAFFDSNNYNKSKKIIEVAIKMENKHRRNYSWFDKLDEKCIELLYKGLAMRYGMYS